MKNKKADVPVMILVLGVLAICGVVLLSFELSMSRFQEDFIGVGVVETARAVAEEIKIDEEKNFGQFPKPEYTIKKKDREVRIRTGKLLVEVDYVIFKGNKLWSLFKGLFGGAQRKEIILASVRYDFTPKP